MRKVAAMNGIAYEEIQSRFTNELALETAFAGAQAVRVLHARLHCGLKLFDGSKLDDSLDIPPFVAKWVCKVLVQLESKGELIERDILNGARLREDGARQKRSESGVGVQAV